MKRQWVERDRIGQVRSEVDGRLLSVLCCRSDIRFGVSSSPRNAEMRQELRNPDCGWKSAFDQVMNRDILEQKRAEGGGDMGPYTLDHTAAAFS